MKFSPIRADRDDPVDRNRTTETFTSLHPAKPRFRAIRRDFPTATAPTCASYALSLDLSPMYAHSHPRHILVCRRYRRLSPVLDGRDLIRLLPGNKIHARLENATRSPFRLRHVNGIFYDYLVRYRNVLRLPDREGIVRCALLSRATSSEAADAAVRR